jgi:hypothetical protein
MKGISDTGWMPRFANMEFFPVERSGDDGLLPQIWKLTNRNHRFLSRYLCPCHSLVVKVHNSGLFFVDRPYFECTAASSEVRTSPVTTGICPVFFSSHQQVYADVCADDV